MNNLHKSEVVLSKILTLLMDWGIQESTLSFDELELDPDEFGVFFYPCIDWLENEGLIRVEGNTRTKDSPYSGEAIMPVLTSFGFHVLGQKLMFEDSEETISTQVKRVSDSGTDYSGFGDFLGGILGGFTKSMSS